MNKRNSLKIFLLLVYLALIVAFSIFAKEKSRKLADEAWCLDSPCVRLCSNGEETSFKNISMDFIELPHPTTNLTTKFVIVDDKPCENKKLLETEQWKFLSSGSILVNETTSFSLNEYCLEVNEDEASNDTDPKFNVMMCDDFSEIYRIVFLSLKASAVGILLIILLLYVFINELKSNLHGKSVIGYLLSMIVAVSCSRFKIYLCDILTMTALSFAFLWINVLIFDVWWTLSYFRSTSGGKFKYFFYYVMFAGLMAFLLRIPFNTLFVSFAFNCYAFTATLACFVFAAMKIYEMTGEEMDFAHKRFSFEEYRFMSYFALFVTTFVTTAIEFCCIQFIESPESFLAADVVSCVQSIIVFILLVLKKHPRDIIIRNFCCC